MVKMLPSLKLLPGVALDLSTVDPDDGLPWDFDLKAKREKGRRLLDEQQPILVVGSPCCRAFSSWQALNNVKRDSDVINRERTRALLHLNFVIELYEMQVRAGRYYEGPGAACHR